jgi:hypothetical protein
MAAAPQRCCGVYESGGEAAAVQTTTASSLTATAAGRFMECGGAAAAFHT